MIGHKQAQELLARRAELAPPDERRLQEHLRGCPTCSELADEYAMQSRLLAALPLVSPPLALRQNVLATVQNSAPSRWRRLRPRPRLAGPVAAAVLAVVVALVAANQLGSSHEHQTAVSTGVPAVVRPPTVAPPVARLLSGNRGASGGSLHRRITRRAGAKPAERRVTVHVPVNNPSGSIAWVGSTPASSQIPPVASPVVVSARGPATISPPPVGLAVLPRRVLHTSSIRSRPAAMAPQHTLATNTTQPVRNSSPISPRPASQLASTSTPAPAISSGAGAVAPTPFPVPTMPATPTPIPLRLPAYIPAPPVDTPTPLTTPIP